MGNSKTFRLSVLVGVLLAIHPATADARQVQVIEAEISTEYQDLRLVGIAAGLEEIGRED